MSTNVYSDNIDPGNEYLYIREMLEVGRPYCIHDMAGEKVSFKKRSGMKIKFRRHNLLDEMTTPGKEGVTGAPAPVSKDDITADLKWYKNYVKLSDVAVDTNVEDVRMIYSQRLGENMEDSRDLIYRDALLGGTSVYYGNNVANRGSVITKIEENDLEAIDRLLFDNKAKYFTSMTKGDTKFGTSSILPSYLVFAHGHTKKDWLALTGWVPVSDYAGQIHVYPSEIGNWNNYRVILTQHGKIEKDSGAAVGGSGLKSTSGANIDVYQTLIFAKGAYHFCPLDGSNVRNIVHDFGSAGSEDPTNDRMTIGYKYATCLAITQDLNMCRLETGASE